MGDTGHADAAVSKTLKVPPRAATRRSRRLPGTTS